VIHGVEACNLDAMKHGVDSLGPKLRLSFPGVQKRIFLKKKGQIVKGFRSLPVGLEQPLGPGRRCSYLLVVPAQRLFMSCPSAAWAPLTQMNPCPRSDAIVHGEGASPAMTCFESDHDTTTRFHSIPSWIAAPPYTQTQPLYIKDLFRFKKFLDFNTVVFF